MRARPPLANVAAIAMQIEMSVGIDRVRALSRGFAAATPDTIMAILNEAAKFADAYLTPLNDVSDAQGCRLVDGRVWTAHGHAAAWAAYVANGWGTLDAPESVGGQGLPLVVAAAVQEIFDRSCSAFGMLPVPQRSASRLIAAHGDDRMRAQWLGKLASGEWGATICISEVEAGSDVGRIRTRAEPDGAGGWRVTGEKCWITFGDHDLTPRIGHCVLARTPGAPPGGAGLSLFLLPSTLEDGSPNAISVRRIEEKMGLHGSPTCALGFEGATAQMIGVEGDGLPQMFVMITNMRLSVGIQGLGIASGACDIALAYAQDRRQGGTGDTPVPIADHADVQRMALDAVSRVEVMRGLALALANQAELAQHEPDPQARAEAAALVQWLLPLVKTAGGEVAWHVADTAIQILGGAGYTREWPVEQAARDARVLTIFEGTTGMQALDLVHRRLLRAGQRGYEAFLRMARADGGDTPLTECLDILEATAQALRANRDDPFAIDAGATAFLHLAALAAMGWIAARLVRTPGTTPAARRLRAAGNFWLGDIAARAACLSAQAQAGSASIAAFRDIV